MAAGEMGKSLKRPERISSSSAMAQLARDPETSILRRSTRVGRLPSRYPHSANTTGPTSPHVLPSSSNKRKRTSSTHEERPTSRASKRFHTIRVDTPTANRPASALLNSESSISTRSQRHRRRHPSVFDEEFPSADTSQAASTSSLPSLPADDPVDSTQRRTRKKENVVGKKFATDSGTPVSPIRTQNRISSLKGKERAVDTSSLNCDDVSSPSLQSLGFSAQRALLTIEDVLPERLHTRSKPTPPPFLQTTLGVSSSVGVPNPSDISTNLEPEQSEETLRRRLPSSALTKHTPKASLTKRKRTLSAGAHTDKKKAKTIELESQNYEDPDSPILAGGLQINTNIVSDSLMHKPTDLDPMPPPNPIPKLIVTPSPPNSSPVTIPAFSPNPHESGPISSVRDQNGSSSEVSWDWNTETQPITPMDSSALEYAPSPALQSNDPVEACSPDDTCGRPSSRTSNGKRNRRRLPRAARITQRPSETLFTLACRERVDYLSVALSFEPTTYLPSLRNRKYYYLGQLRDYEADQAFEFFTRISASSKLDAASSTSNNPPSSASSPPTRPQSPTWSLLAHWEGRLQDAGDWDGHMDNMHPLVSPPASTDQDIPDREPDFRTEDYFPFELAESDEEEEERTEHSSTSDPSSGAAITDEEHEDTESDESDESEDFLAVQCEGEMQLTLPVYTPTPSSLAEALTPLVPSEPSQNVLTGVFALPVSPPSKKLEFPQEVPPFVTRSPTPEEKDIVPPPLSIPPPPLATIIPAQSRLHESDRFSEIFQQEILPACQADKVRELFQNDMPVTFSTSTCPSVLRAEIERQAVNRLRTPYTRLLNYASRKLGSIGHGTPIDPNRRRNLIAWLEDRKTVEHASTPVKAYAQNDEEQLPPLGSAAWYAMRFPLTLSSDSVINSAACKSNAFMMPSGPIASSPQALLAGNQHQIERQATFDANWPPLTIQPGELETFRNQDWMDPKAYFGDGGVSSSDIMQNVFQQGSSHGCGTDQAHYEYPQAATGNSNHDATPHGNGELNHNTASNVAPLRFSPKIAMDENLSDEDAEGDIDPDVIQSVSVSRFTNSSTIASSGRSLTTVAHGNDSFRTSVSAGMDSFPVLPSHVHSNESIGFGSSRPSSEFHDGGRMGIYGGTVGPIANDIVGHTFPNVEMSHSGSVPSRSFTDTSPASFPDSGIQGVGMNLNVGVSVGFGVSMGMGINRFGMDMMGVGVGLGMIGFPVVETDSWFLPGSSPPSSSLPSPSTNGEYHEHGVGGMGAFGNNSIYNDSLPDHARERYGSPSSTESAYPLGFAMG
ncbi:hypothetical protein DFH05DRAFT_1457116 [Lentinula detonsa]|uniref:Uncharacterized protein n=1 Tax=Lentinula detonsa TaxID=2804962 RepID=A0A9W8P8T2_9AGAR|nr:hypothetical protein DFH05DRAFT_1457116 [Lentinula detonsa]